MNQLQKNFRDLRHKMMPSQMTETVLSGGTSRPAGQRITMSMRTYWYVLAFVAVVALYYYVFASDRYATTSQFFIKSAEPQTPTTLQTGLLQAPVPGSQDALQLREYMLSADMLALLEASLGVRAHFSDSGWDYFSRLSSRASQEEALDYYRDHVKVYVSPETAIVTLETQGFDKVFSEQINEAILHQADIFINRINQAIAEQEVAFINEKLEENKYLLADAETALLTFQNQKGTISSEGEALATQELLAALDAKLVEAEAELRTLESYLSPQAPQVVALQGQVSALKATRRQLVEDKITGTQGTVNEESAQLKRLELQVKFAADLYQSALGVLAQKQVESSRKAKYLAIIQKPRLAEDAKYPDRLYIVATLLILMTIAYGVGVMIIATVQEHRDV